MLDAAGVVSSTMSVSSHSPVATWWWYDWVGYPGGPMFVVRYTEGGAPYGYVEWTGQGSVGSDGGPIPCEHGVEPF